MAQDYESWLGSQGYEKGSPWYSAALGNDKLKGKWREQVGWDGDAWDMEHRGHQGGGYLPGSRAEMQKYLDFLSGKRANTEGINAFNLSSEKGQEARFLSRAGYMQYMNDPNVSKYREHLEGLMEGGAEDKLRKVAQDTASRASASSRSNTNDYLSSQLGAGVSAPGVGAYLNKRMDSALQGQLGQAYQQAALQDLSIRSTAGQALQNEALVQQNLIQRIISASEGSTQWNQRLPEAPNPWNALGMQALGTGLGALGGAMMGPIGGAIGQGIGSSINSNAQYGGG